MTPENSMAGKEESGNKIELGGGLMPLPKPPQEAREADYDLMYKILTEMTGDDDLLRAREVQCVRPSECYEAMINFGDIKFNQGYGAAEKDYKWQASLSGSGEENKDYTDLSKGYVKLTNENTALKSEIAALKASSSTGMEWVKASERSLQGKIWRVRFHEHGTHSINPLDFIGEEGHLLKFKNGIEYLRSNVEWLDESTPVAESNSEGEAFNMFNHLLRQRTWSEKTFGPDKRTGGVIEHIRQELKEIEAKPEDISEWIDVTILALDGAWRHGYSPDQIIAALVAKQTKNEARVWPDWRTLPTDKAINHDRTKENQPPSEGKEWTDGPSEEEIEAAVKENCPKGEYGEIPTFYFLVGINYTKNWLSEYKSKAGKP